MKLHLSAKFGLVNPGRGGGGILLQVTNLTENIGQVIYIIRNCDMLMLLPGENHPCPYG